MQKEYVTSSTVGDISGSYIHSFENQVIVPFNLKQGASYGPFYYVGGKDLSPFIPYPLDNKKERATFFGFEKPMTDWEAEELYYLKVRKNPLEYIHTINISVPAECEDAYLFIGPVNHGKGIQVLLNRSVVNKCTIASGNPEKLKIIL